MASFNPKVFIRPDGLKRIANVHLIALLEPWRAYFSWRGLAFPTSADEEFPHEELAKILLTYDPEMPIELMNGLYYIDEAASNETLDDLLDRAHEEGIAIASHGKSTPADVAVQIYLARPALLEERAVRAMAFDKTAFAYFPGRVGEGRDLPDVTEPHLKRIADLMDPWFESKQRGRGARIFVYHRDDKFWLVVRHGMPMVREGKHEEDGEAGVAFYRPQKHDVMIYDAATDLLGINAGSKGENDLYRHTLGEVVFGSRTYFGDGDVFTLAPIRRDGPAIQECDDIEGIKRVRLLEVVRVIVGEVVMIDIKRSKDLFRAFGGNWSNVLGPGRITSAKLGFVFEGSNRERKVHLRLDSARYDRDDDAELVETWLRSRGFFAIDRLTDVIDEDEPVLEGA